MPVLVTHGRDDAIILPSMAEISLEHCRTAEVSWYDGVGHMPFWESPERFDRELADFAMRVNGLARGRRWRAPAAPPTSTRVQMR